MVLTVRMVMNHTGGFTFESSVKRKEVRGGGWSGGARVRQVASVAADSQLRFEPGTDVLYSNTGIDIGAAIVEVITGMKWEDYLKQEVLDPLDMKSTWFWPTDKQIKNKIELYEYKENAPAEWREEMEWETEKMLMNLGIGENGVRILKEETVKNLLAVSSRPKELAGYSLGLHTEVEDSEDAWFGHGGAWGTRCYVNYHKKQLRLWVIQTAGGPQPWKEAMDKATEQFFAQQLEQSGEYTGRTE